MSMAAADFHQAIMPAGIGQAADFVRRLRNYVGIAKLVYNPHCVGSSPSSNP